MTAVEALEIRALEERDLEALARGLGFSRHHVADRWRERCAGEPGTLVADLEGSTVGAVSFDERDLYTDLLHLYALGVVPERQRRGIGTRLIAAVEREAVARGLAGVYLAVATDNVSAMRLYERLGYARTGGPYVARWTWYGFDGETREIVEHCVRMVKR